MVIFDNHIISSGSGKYRVWLEKHQLGSDLVFFLGGGERPHVGGMVVCEKGKPAQVVSLEGHYDAMVLTFLAEAACKKYGQTVVLIGGIHIDRASKDEIETLVQNCRLLIPEL
jgi:gallate decarboxylase subunit D